MRAIFANLTRADFRGRSHKERQAAERRYVHALFDETQVAIYNGDHIKVNYLMAELAAATGKESADDRSARLSA